MSRIDPAKIIDRAAIMIRDGYPQGEVEPGVWLCWSQRYGAEKIYTVTAYDCSCWMGENKRSIVCKHRFACHAPLIVDFIQNMRDSNGLDELRSLGEAYAEEMKRVPECFVDYARKEYEMKRDELKEQAA